MLAMNGDVRSWNMKVKTQDFDKCPDILVNGTAITQVVTSPVTPQTSAADVTYLNKEVVKVTSDHDDDAEMKEQKAITDRLTVNEVDTNANEVYTSEENDSGDESHEPGGLNSNASGLNICQYKLK